MHHKFEDTPLNKICSESSDGSGKPYNSSRLNNGKDIDDLKQSIRSLGLIQAITVYYNSATGCYEVLSGHRRLEVYVALNEENPNDGYDAIPSIIIEEPETEDLKKSLGLAEGLTHIQMDRKDLIKLANERRGYKEPREPWDLRIRYLFSQTTKEKRNLNNTSIYLIWKKIGFGQSNLKYKQITAGLLELVKLLYKNTPSKPLIYSDEAVDTVKVIRTNYTTKNDRYVITKDNKVTITLDPTENNRHYIKSMTDTTLVPHKGLIDEMYEEINMGPQSSVELIWVEGTWYVLSSDGLKTS